MIGRQVRHCSDFNAMRDVLGNNNVKDVRVTPKMGEMCRCSGANNEDVYFVNDKSMEQVAIGVQRPAVPSRVLSVEVSGYQSRKQVIEESVPLPIQRRWAPRREIHCY